MGNNASGCTWDNLQESSSPHMKFNPRHADPLAVRLMLPVYYSGTKLTKDDILVAKNCWDIIVSNSCPMFIQRKEMAVTEHDFPFENSVAWFYSVFYNRLFDVHPLCRNMFMDPKTQTRFFTALMGFIFTSITDEKAFKKKLLILALSHCRKGVKAIEYGIIGEVMFWSLKTVLDELYDKDSHRAWVKLFSSMLSIIVPVAVGHELESNAAQLDRMAIVSHNHSYSYKAPVHSKGLQKAAAGPSQAFDVRIHATEEGGHTSATIHNWEKTHKRQGNTLIDGIDCYS